VKLPDSLEAVISAFQKLPGIGTKSAQRMALYLLKEGPLVMDHLGDLLKTASSSVSFCELCGGFSDRRICKICTDPNRDVHTMIIVAEASNIYTFERSGYFKGHYHVLGGLISPLKGIGPNQLRIAELLERLNNTDITEIIVATNPTLNGEATATWLARVLESRGIKITRIGLGLPIGSDLEYADDLTLNRAIEGRKLF
jgi:recombination protein RecR